MLCTSAQSVMAYNTWLHVLNSVALQALAEELACLQEAADMPDELEGAHTDVDTMHMALKEVVDALDSKAAQLYALQQL